MWLLSRDKSPQVLIAFTELQVCLTVLRRAITEFKHLALILILALRPTMHPQTPCTHIMFMPLKTQEEILLDQ